MLRIEVRRAAEGDAEAAMALVRQSIVELCSADHHNDQGTLSQWLENKTTANFRKWVSDPENYCVVGELDGKLSGVGLLRSGEILLFYMKPEATRRGLGRAILARLEMRAIELGLHEIRLCSTATAKPFYESAGYLSSGEPRHVNGVLLSHPYRKKFAQAV